MLQPTLPVAKPFRQCCCTRSLFTRRCSEPSNHSSARSTHEVRGNRLLVSKSTTLRRLHVKPEKSQPPRRPRPSTLTAFAVSSRLACHPKSSANAPDAAETTRRPRRPFFSYHVADCNSRKIERSKISSTAPSTADSTAKRASAGAENWKMASGGVLASTRHSRRLADAETRERRRLGGAAAAHMDEKGRTPWWYVAQPRGYHTSVVERVLQQRGWKPKVVKTPRLSLEQTAAVAQFIWWNVELIDQQPAKKRDAARKSGAVVSHDRRAEENFTEAGEPIAEKMEALSDGGIGENASLAGVAPPPTTTTLLSCFLDLSTLCQKHLLWNVIRQYLAVPRASGLSVRDVVPWTWVVDLGVRPSEGWTAALRRVQSESHALGIRRWIVKASGGANGCNLFLSNDIEQLLRDVEAMAYMYESMDADFEGFRACGLGGSSAGTIPRKGAQVSVPTDCSEGSVPNRNGESADVKEQREKLHGLLRLHNQHRSRRGLRRNKGVLAHRQWVLQEFVEQVPLLFSKYRFFMKLSVLLFASSGSTVDVLARRNPRIHRCFTPYDPSVFSISSTVGNWKQQRSHAPRSRLPSLLFEDDLAARYPLLRDGFRRAVTAVRVTVEAAIRQLSFRPGCFELTGWDFVMEERATEDAEARAWWPLLLEVNHRPGCGSDRAQMEVCVAEVVEWVVARQFQTPSTSSSTPNPPPTWEWVCTVNTELVE